MNVRLIVLNYNGGRVLAECLPSLLEAARASRHKAAVTLLDNGSTDGSVELARGFSPELEVVRSRENRVLCSYNEFLAGISDPYVILLNNDLRVERDFIDPLIEGFEKNSDIFMTTPKCLTFDGSGYDGGRCRARMKFGLYWSACRFPGYEAALSRQGETMAAGFGAFDRKKFLELGGYDDLYLPGRLEDNDLCFRAWRRGWRCIYEPRSVVYHKGAASFNDAFGPRKTLILGHRNSFLFLWKNLRDGGYWLEHALLLVPRLLFALMTGKPELALGFWEALPRLPEALRRRREARTEPSFVSDREIFSKVA